MEDWRQRVENNSLTPGVSSTPQLLMRESLNVQKASSSERNVKRNWKLLIDLDMLNLLNITLVKGEVTESCMVIGEKSEGERF